VGVIAGLAEGGLADSQIMKAGLEGSILPESEDMENIFRGNPSIFIWLYY
jgi:hypothetical protein